VRYLVPVLFFGGAGYVWHYNETHDDSWLLLPFLDMLASLEGDVEAQAEWTWRILVAIGALMLVWTFVDDVRRRGRRKAREDEPVAAVDPDQE